ncbi:WD40 repeat domain-containing protein [Streptomyces pseudovenezuelae]|uniref:hypothetical protein n=1 Tax=Streptomyces pseudovenezuelae TaxID=67350 RepID=UPI002E816550|nr:hypothetical protein [Streptomyces pseudovenezuelae]WUA86355.1 hypothetical protein OHO81_03260 [Streptomyces pseudovenezuelae]
MPSRLGAIADLTPVIDGQRPVWLTLGEDGTISRWDVATGDHEAVGATAVRAEPGHEPWSDRELRRRLHSPPDGMFAAVVNDYGRFGEVIDLRTGEVTLDLESEGHHSETVPFSLAFGQHLGRCVVIHRTEWNRLDVSDAQTGEALTARSSPAPTDGVDLPEHYLDYFHGALFVSPDGKRILDDGWIWHPIGVPSVWDLDPWIEGNVWESEDGPSRVEVCDRADYWDHAMTWLDSARVAIGGIGDHDAGMRPGARIFDTSRAGRSGTAVELLAFEGPTGPFFSDGTHLFSCGDTGLSIWDPVRGKLLGDIPGFSPTRHHPGARQFPQLTDGVVRLWTSTF